MPSNTLILGYLSLYQVYVSSLMESTKFPVNQSDIIFTNLSFHFVFVQNNLITTTFIHKIKIIYQNAEK